MSNTPREKVNIVHLCDTFVAFSYAFGNFAMTDFHSIVFAAETIDGTGRLIVRPEHWKESA